MSISLKTLLGGLLSPRYGIIDHPPALNARLPRLLLSVALDTSSSMYGDPIAQVNKKLAELVPELSQDTVTRDSMELQMVTFGGTVQVHPYVPVRDFSPPVLRAGGCTPMPEAMLFAMEETERRKVFLESIEISVLVPHYFLLTDGAATSPPDVIELAGEAIHQIEERGGGAFYAFVTNQGARDALQPLFPRKVQLLAGANLAKFFRIISASACSVSQTSVSPVSDLTPMIERQLLITHESERDA